MKKHILIILLVIAFGLGTIMLTGCPPKKEEAKGTPTPAPKEESPAPSKPVKLELSVKEIKFVKKGEEQVIQATLLDEKNQIVKEGMVSWSSSSDTVATVNNGKVVAVGSGSATIIAKAAELEAKAEVTVQIPARIVLTPDKFEVWTNVQDKMEQEVTAEVLDDKDQPVDAVSLVWTIEDNEVAIVSNGKVSGVKAGKTVVTAEFEGIKGTAMVEVKTAAGVTAPPKKDDAPAVPGKDKPGKPGAVGKGKKTPAKKPGGVGKNK